MQSLPDLKSERAIKEHKIVVKRPRDECIVTQSWVFLQKSCLNLASTSSCSIYNVSRMYCYKSWSDVTKRLLPFFLFMSNSVLIYLAIEILIPTQNESKWFESYHSLNAVRPFEHHRLSKLCFLWWSYPTFIFVQMKPRKSWSCVAH